MKDIIKRASSLFLAAAVLILCGAFSFESAALEDPVIENAKAALVYNFENNMTIFEYNIDETLYPTSTVKIMTGIIAVERLGDRLDETVTVTAAMLENVVGNNIGLKVGEIVKVEDLLYALLANCANDAAYVLAYHISGSVEDFVKLMNQRALELGAYDTHYTNPTGMHNDSMVTTLRDTFAISKYAYTLELYMQITSTAKYVMDATNLSQYRNICNRNCLISAFYGTGYLYSGAKGMNAGSTSQGGYSLVSTADDGDLTYLVIVMGASADDEKTYSYENGIKLFDWAFDSYAYRTVLSEKQTICELPVTLSSTVDYVTLVPSSPIVVYMPSDVDLESEITYSYNTTEDELMAPIKAGSEYGSVTVMYDNQILGSVPLVATASVTRSEFLYFLLRVKEFTDSKFFSAMIVTAVVLTVIYVITQAILRDREKRGINRRRKY